MSERPPGVKDYKGAAGGWGALKAVAGALSDQETVVEGGRTLLRANQPEGFDCPGCAWPDPKHTSSFEFCENGAKAVAWESTTKRTTPAFFAEHTVTELLDWSDHALEDQGRLTEPMRYDPMSDRYLAATWEEAFAAIGAALRALDHPDQAEFYASGRASNEAAFLFQLMGRLIGKPGAGICPLRGHSNVQGARTVGVAEKPSAALLDRMEQVFGLPMPCEHGHTVVEAIEAILDGRSKVLISLGGNFAVAAPDPRQTHEAMRRLELSVNIATKLNRTHLLHGGEAWLLPCLGRTEMDEQATGRQAVTVEDSMSMVHASRGLNPPASPQLKSEPAIVAGIARAALGPGGVDWEGLVGDYDRIRDLIEQVFPETFAGYNERIRTPGGFRLPVPPSSRDWRTASGKANFIPYQADGEDPRRGDPEVLLLTTVRSHDQYNTTIYGQNDRYRGVSGRRDVVFLSPADLERLGIAEGDLLDVEAAFPEAGEAVRAVRGFIAVARDLPRGSAAAYYPEVNGLVSLDQRDRRSGTPAYKSIPVRIRPVRR